MKTVPKCSSQKLRVAARGGPSSRLVHYGTLQVERRRACEGSEAMERKGQGIACGMKATCNALQLVLIFGRKTLGNVHLCFRHGRGNRAKRKISRHFVRMSGQICLSAHRGCDLDELCSLGHTLEAKHAENSAKMIITSG